MTEEEAKTKWCPFARVACAVKTTINGVGNRLADGKNDNLNPTASSCIGSQCMAWRLSKKAKEVGDTIGWTNRKTRDVCKPIKAEEYQPAEGYCGLVGKP